MEWMGDVLWELTGVWEILIIPSIMLAVVAPQKGGDYDGKHDAGYYEYLPCPCQLP